MIDHTGIGVADVSRSARFYDVALGVLGLRRVIRFVNIQHSWRTIGRRWTPSMPQPSGQVGPTMASPANAGHITTQHSFSIPTVIIWKPCFAATEGCHQRTK